MGASQSSMFFGQGVTLIGLSQKNHDTFNIPQMKAFSINSKLR
jgi:hypothetical protein